MNIQTPEAQDRTDTAIAIVDEIKRRFEAGSSFSHERMGEDFISLKERLKAYQRRTVISPRTLKYMRAMNKAVKGKKL